MLSIKNYTLTIKNGNQEFTLYNINIDLQKGSSLIIRGKNGSGKTTLLKAISSQTPKHAKETGEILLYNDVISPKKITYLDINADIIPNITVYEHLLLGLKFKSRFSYFMKKSQKYLIIEHYEKYLISHYGLYDYCNSFSKGEKALLLLATTLINPNDIVLLDEPTANLDEENKQNVVTLIKDIWNIKKFILVIASHDSFIKTNFSDALFLDIIKKGNRAIIPIEQILKKRTLSDETLKDFDLVARRDIYSEFVEFAAKHWEFGLEVNQKEKDFLEEDFDNKKILIIGCGIGREAIFLQEHFKANITCLDISQSMLEECSINTNGELNYVKGDICKQNEQFLSSDFDVIICLGNTIGGFLDTTDREMFFSNCSNLLRNDGLLIFDATLASEVTYKYYNSLYKCYKVVSENNSFGLFIDYAFSQGRDMTLYQHYHSTAEINLLLHDLFVISMDETYVHGFERILIKCNKINSLNE